nr:unnamed protein product [Callosobruchus chinensis]
MSRDAEGLCKRELTTTLNVCVLLNITQYITTAKRTGSMGAVIMRGGGSAGGGGAGALGSGNFPSLAGDRNLERINRYINQDEENSNITEETSKNTKWLNRSTEFICTRISNICNTFVIRCLTWSGVFE